MLKKFLFPVVALFLFLPGKTQLPEIGQAFPSFLIRDVLNGPSAVVDVQQVAEPFIIINFWGTWCSPCLPEMDSLGLLQKKYASQVRIIAVASDPIDRVSKYLEKKPTSVWVSSDTNFYMYRFLGFDYVGQSVVLNKDRRMLAFVRTDSINDRFLKSLTNARPVHSSAERSSRVGFQSDEQDPFPADSQRIQRWVYESYRPGSASMMRTYPNGPFQGRRLSFINVCADNILRTAFDINTPALVKYEIPEATLCDFSSKKGVFCFDLIVAPWQRDSLYLLLQMKLRELLPFKFRLEKQLVPVYVLRVTDSLSLKQTTFTQSRSYFSGRGFTGEKVELEVFADYLSNELGLPVVDETGLQGEFDIQTNLIERSGPEIKKSILQLGLTIEKGERELQVLVIYGNTATDGR